jgi:drug/metabolite transporter (DMT)-like permease
LRGTSGRWSLLGLTANDLNLLLVVLSWGLNLAVVKFAFLELEPLAFNAVRFTAATAILLVVLRKRGESAAVSGLDAVRMLVLGLVGHTLYQGFFIEGIARTTASHAALIFGVTPVVVALLSHLLRHERVGTAGWAGTAIAFGGVYIIIAGKAPEEGPAPSLLGDGFVLLAAISWCFYTVLAKPLLQRHSPLKMTAVTMTLGAVFIVPLCVPALGRQDWNRVTLVGWSATLYALLFPLVLAYVLWYRSVLKVGSVRTAVYANLVPVVGTLSGWLFLDERLYPALGLGAAAIFIGIALTKGRAPRDGTEPERARAAGAAGDP